MPSSTSPDLTNTIRPTPTPRLRPRPRPELSPGDNLRYAEYIPLGCLIIPIIGSSIHGTLTDWQHPLLCVIVIFYVVYGIRLPWQLLRVSQLTLDDELDPHQKNSKNSKSRKTYSYVFQLRSIELIALVSIIVSPLLSIGLLRFLHSVINPGSAPIGRLPLRVFIVALGLKPAGYVIELIRHRTVFGKRSDLPRSIHETRAIVDDLVFEFDRSKQRIEKLETRLASDPELESMRNDAEISLGKLMTHLKERESSIDRVSINESIQLEALRRRIMNVKNEGERVSEEGKRLSEQNVGRTTGWVWEMMIIGMRKVIEIERSRQRLINWFGEDHDHDRHHRIHSNRSSSLPPIGHPQFEDHPSSVYTNLGHDHQNHRFGKVVILPHPAR